MNNFRAPWILDLKMALNTSNLLPSTTPNYDITSQLATLSPFTEVWEPGGVKSLENILAKYFTTTSAGPSTYNATTQFGFTNIIRELTKAPVLSPPTTRPFTLWEEIVIWVFVGILCFMTVIGNIMVVLAFLKDSSIRQPNNYCIVSLAVSDLLIGLFSMPFYTLYLLLDYWPLGPVLCDLWLTTDYTACLVSQYTVLLITIDRYCSVKIPAKYRAWRTNRKLKCLIFLVWFISFAIFFTSIVGWPFITGVRVRTDFECYVPFRNNKTFNTTLIFIYYWMSLVILIVLYYGIYRVAYKIAKKSDNRKLQTTLIQGNAIIFTTAKTAIPESSFLHGGGTTTGMNCLNTKTSDNSKMTTSITKLIITNHPDHDNERNIVPTSNLLLSPKMHTHTKVNRNFERYNTFDHTQRKSETSFSPTTSHSKSNSDNYSVSLRDGSNSLLNSNSTQPNYPSDPDTRMRRLQKHKSLAQEPIGFGGEGTKNIRVRGLPKVKSEEYTDNEKREASPIMAMAKYKPRREDASGEHLKLQTFDKITTDSDNEVPVDICSNRSFSTTGQNDNQHYSTFIDNHNEKKKGQTFQNQQQKSYTEEDTSYDTHKSSMMDDEDNEDLEDICRDQPNVATKCPQLATKKRFLPIPPIPNPLCPPTEVRNQAIIKLRRDLPVGPNKFYDSFPQHYQYNDDLLTEALKKRKSLALGAPQPRPARFDVDQGAEYDERRKLLSTSDNNKYDRDALSKGAIVFENKAALNRILSKPGEGNLAINNEIKPEIKPESKKSHLEIPKHRLGDTSTLDNRHNTRQSQVIDPVTSESKASGTMSMAEKMMVSLKLQKSKKAAKLVKTKSSDKSNTTNNYSSFLTSALPSSNFSMGLIKKIATTKKQNNNDIHDDPDDEDDSLTLPVPPEGIAKPIQKLKFRKKTKSNNQTSQQRQQKKQKNKNSRARKALKTITCIMGAFVLCWTPYHILETIWGVCDNCYINPHFYAFTYWLCYLNSPLNPFMYALANVHFKRAFIKLLNCRNFD